MNSLKILTVVRFNLFTFMFDCFLFHLLTLKLIVFAIGNLFAKFKILLTVKVNIFVTSLHS